MAFAQILIRRECPKSYFEQLEETVASRVGDAVYGVRYPDDAPVDAATQYGRLDTYMALKVEIDTEDLPAEGWVIAPSGLCLPPGTLIGEGAIYERVTEAGLTDKQRNAHFAVLGRRICTSVAADPMWETGKIGWQTHMDPQKKLGVLVARAEGAWSATYSAVET